MYKKIKKHISENLINKPWEPGQWIKYSGPSFSEDEYLAAIESLLKGWLIFGEKCGEFQEKFPAYLGKKHGVFVNSGSSANLLMMLAFVEKYRGSISTWKDCAQDGGAGYAEVSSVITPVSAFPTTVNPIISCGLEPLFVDVALPSLNLDLDKVEEILKHNDGVVAIMFAHVLGNPPDMDRLMGLCEEYDVALLEDCCDAVGGTYKGRKLGSFGELSTVSFFPAHHITGGEGGLIATDDDFLFKTLASLRSWGRDCMCDTISPGDVTGATACKNRFRDWLGTGTPCDHRYVYKTKGLNLKPLEIQGAILLEQLKKFPQLEAARKANHKRLFSIFKPYEEFFHLPVATPNSDPSWFAFLLTLKEGVPFTRNDIVTYLESKKIQTRNYFSGNILRHPAYKDYSGQVDNFPVGDYVADHSFFLGVFQGITEPMLDYIEEVVREFMERLG